MSFLFKNYSLVKVICWLDVISLASLNNTGAPPPPFPCPFIKGGSNYEKVDIFYHFVVQRIIFYLKQRL